MFPSILKYTYYFIVRIGKRTLRKIWPKDLLKLIEPFKVMLSRGKTISDEIIDFAGKRGFKRSDKGISNSIAAEIDLCHSERLLKEIISTENLIKNYID